MNIIMLFVFFVLIWGGYWAATTIIPNIPAVAARILLVLCVVLTIFLVLKAFGILPTGGGGDVPQIG